MNSGTGANGDSKRSVADFNADRTARKIAGALKGSGVSVTVVEIGGRRRA